MWNKYTFMNICFHKNDIWFMKDFSRVGYIEFKLLKTKLQS